MRRGHAWCLPQSRELSPCLGVSLPCLQIEILPQGLFMLLFGVHKKVVECPLGPCSLSLLWENLTSVVLFFVGFFFSWVEVNKLGSWTAGELPCQPLGLVILQQAAEAVTSECKVRTVSPAGIPLKDWLLLRCAGREKFGTTASALLVVCNPAAKSLLFPA